jgi:hypothetical protein
MTIGGGKKLVSIKPTGTTGFILSDHGNIYSTGEIKSFRLVGEQHPFRQDEQGFGSARLPITTCADCYRKWEDLCHERRQERLV